MISTKVLGLPQSIGIDQRPDKKYRQGFIGTPATAAGNKNNSFPCLHLATPWARASLFLSGREGRRMSRGLVEGWLSYFACPLGGGVFSGYAQFSCFCSWPPDFAPASSKVAFGFFGLFISFVHNFALTTMHTVIFGSRTRYGKKY